MDVGYPFENIQKDKYLFLEMHYDNPLMLDNITDDSGVRLYLTKQLREHELGILTVGKFFKCLHVDLSNYFN